MHILIALRRRNALVNIESENDRWLRLLLSAVMWFTTYAIVTQTVKTHFHILNLHFCTKAVLSLDTVITVIMHFKISCGVKSDFENLKPIFVKECS